MAAASCEWVEIAPGFRGYYASPEGKGPFPSVLIYIEAFGVNSHFQALAKRYAEAGFAALVPDIYDGATYGYDEVPKAVGHLKKLQDDDVMARMRKALDFLDKRAEADGQRVGVTGYCMGGRYTFLANAELAGRFKGAVSFYGGGIGPVKDFAGRPILLDRATDMGAPIMLFYGAEDGSIAPDEVGRIAEALTKANKGFTLTVFPQVGHGFFCDERSSYDKSAAAASWDATLAFFREHL